MNAGAWAIVLLAAAGASVAWGDEVLFKNGDRLTGEVKSAAGGKLIIATKVAGEVTVNMADVKTFSTDKPVVVQLEDGTVLKQPLAQAAEGQVRTAPGGVAQPQAIPIASVAKINPSPSKWSGSLQAGAIVTRGNSYSDAVTIAADAQRRSEQNRLTLKGGYNYGTEKVVGETTSQTTIENWNGSGKYDYFLTPKWYLYANAKAEKDRIANLDLRFSPGVGVGYQWLESSVANFNTEAGPAWVYERYTNPNVTREYVALRLAYHYDRTLNESVKFIHNVEYLPSVEDTRRYLVNADAGLRVSLTGNFFTEIKVVLGYNSEPAEGKQNSDVKYVANVGWRF